MKTYTDLSRYKTYEHRLEYLKLDDKPTDETFGILRSLNQKFYNSQEWRRVRAFIIGRDLGYDLGVPGKDIFGKVIVHHINPLTPKDLYYNTDRALDPENLITVSYDTHLSIHFGYDANKNLEIERFRGDTKLW